MTTRPLRFLHQGRTVEIGTLAAPALTPMTTVLDWLRLDRGLTGTKEGCAEGDCGACTVALGRVKHGRLTYEPANACILLLGQLDGAELITVEDLAEAGRLHPVQQALVDHHASQCGFCTPGFVMSLFTLYQEGGQNGGASREAILARLAGNLCRCTGYRPIVDAALEACAGAPDDRFTRQAEATAASLAALADGEDLMLGDAARFFAAPASLASLSALCEAHPDAVIVGGATDIGLWITKQLKDLPKLIHTGRVPELRRLAADEQGLTIGGAVTYAEAAEALAALDPDVGLWLSRLGSTQVRAAGTIGGNIANGSPIGDSPPLLIALGATLHLRRGAATRALPLKAFFLDYGKQDRAPGEIVTHVTVPRPAAGTHIRAYKIAKRHDQDISSVMAALAVEVEGRTIRAARIAFGGMAGIPKRAGRVEAALAGVRLDDQQTIATAAARIADDFQPMSDHRATTRYRLKVAENLILKAMEEIARDRRDETRVPPLREAAHG